jgi:hypothetical protein
VDHSQGERGHAWPQALPRGGFLYFAENNRPANVGIYSASLARPAERVHLLSTNSNALYAPGGDGTDYLVWYRTGALVAQELDAVALKMRGAPRLIAARPASTHETQCSRLFPPADRCSTAPVPAL